MKLNASPKHHTQMEIFHELDGHQPQFFVSESTPAPVMNHGSASENNLTMHGLFLDRLEPFAVPRKSKLTYTFHCN